MSTKTLRKRIALVAVSAMGFGLLSVAPTSAAVTATGTASFKAAGSTTAVTNASGAFNAASSAAVETIYVRSGTTTNTFVVDFASLTAADALHVVLGKGTAMPAVAADLVNIDGVSVTAANATIADATLDVDGSGSIATVAAAGVTVTTKSLQTAAADFKFTSGALAAGTYSIWVATDNTDLTATSYKLATVTSYNVGAPVTASYSVDGRTIVNGSAPATSAYDLRVLDSAGRRTFLVGDEVVKHSWATVASGVQVLDAIADTTAGIAPTTTNGGITFTAYVVTADTNGAGDNAALTTGVTYTLTSVIQSGVNAFGSDTVTVRHLTSTNGLAGTLVFRNSTTLATVPTISLATADGITTGYQLVLRDSAGAVVQGVRPTVSSSSSATTAQGGTTDAAGLTSTTDWTYTAPAQTSDTVTFTVTAGTSASITTSVAIAIGASYATADYDGAIAVTANGGRVASGTQSNTTRADLSGGDAVYDHLILNPANTTTVTVTYTLLNNAAPKLPVSGATLSFAVGAPTSSVGGGASTLPTAARVLSATSVATGADGKAAVTVTITGARTNEEFGVVISSGGTQIGYADFLFTDAAVAIGSVFAGPAQTITQGAGTATTVTLTALDQYSQAAVGTRIQLLVTGPSAPTSNPIVTTGADGTATYNVSGTTAVAGQTDTVTITNLNGGGSVTAGADDVVTINYLATAPVAGSIRQDFDLAQGTSWTNNAVTTIADAIKALNASVQPVLQISLALN
jgi:trimeric autotransporter adhesin